MKPAPFAYHTPATLQELLEVFAEHADSARVLAGGQSLMPLLNARRARPRHVIDLNQLTNLDHIDVTPTSLTVGALVRQERTLVSSEVATAAPLVTAALRHVASPTVRNRGTVCGSIAFAHPAGELPAAALAMGGTVVARHVDGERTIALDEFFVGPFATALRQGEVITEVRLNRWKPATGFAFLEVSRMRWPVVCAAALVSLDGDVVSQSALAVAGVAAAPVRDSAIEAAFAGVVPTKAAIDGAADAFSLVAAAGDDAHGTAAYRDRVARVLVRRALALAVKRAARPAA